MPEATITKELLYARLEEIRRLAELVRNTHHDCAFDIRSGGKRGAGCLLPEFNYAPGPACGEPQKPKPEQVLDGLVTLADSIQRTIKDFAEFYGLSPRLTNS
ncbi:MAG: hypothetical protein JXA73_02615 [Acidobacteria bacterium]|nr:hypothetical protein [Acidobacteriota bacterium]